MNATEPSLRLERREDDIASPVVGRSTRTREHTLRAELAVEFQQVLEVLQDSSAAKALIIISAKPDNFIAGANLDMLQSVQSIAEGRELAELSQAMQQSPRLAANARGGGHTRELPGRWAWSSRWRSMDACRERRSRERGWGFRRYNWVCSRAAEVPSACRASSVLATPCGLLLSGRQVAGDEALALGLVDAVVEPRATLGGGHRTRSRHGGAPPPDGPSAGAAAGGITLSTGAASCELLRCTQSHWSAASVRARAPRRLLDKTRGNYPAPERILEVVRKGLEQGIAAGFAAEARAFGDLVVSPQSRALMRMFFATRELAKDSWCRRPANGEARDVDAVGMAGRGSHGRRHRLLVRGQSRARRSPSGNATGRASRIGLQRLRDLVDARVQRNRLSSEAGESHCGARHRQFGSDSAAIHEPYHRGGIRRPGSEA